MNAGQGARRAALLLHTLPVADRRALLARFDPHESALLETLLQELSALGIPQDRALLEQTIKALPADHAGVPGSGTTDLIACLQAADPSELAHALTGETGEVIAKLLSCAQWRWAGDFLAALDPFKRRQVQALLHDCGPVPPHLCDALLRGVWHVLRESCLCPPQQLARSGLWSRARARLAGMRRANR